MLNKKVILQETHVQAMSDNESTSTELIKPVYFEEKPQESTQAENNLIKPIILESKLVKPAIFESEPIKPIIYDSDLIKPIIFENDSDDPVELDMPCDTNNVSAQKVQVASESNLQIQKAPPFVPCLSVGHYKKLIEIDPHDAGNLERFFIVHGDMVKFDCESKKFYIWNGRFWEIDKKNVVKQLCKIALLQYFQAAQPLQHSPVAAEQRLYTHALSCCNAGKINALAKMLSDNCTVDSQEFDTQTHLLNVRNGIINLKTGQLLPHDRNLLLSKYIDIDFIPERAGTAYNFNNFLRSISCDNPEFISDLQLIFGYGITGETREQVMFLLHGTGSNGKTTLIEAIRRVVAPFVKIFPIEQLTSKVATDGTKPNPALAAASSARILFTSESNEKDSLNEGRVKSLTGGNTLTTHDKFKSTFEFLPKFKIYFDTNFLPKIKGLDFAIWRRIKVLKFQATFTPDTVDVKLPEKLRTQHEQEGILSWLVAGAVRYYNNGLVLSDDVAQATEEYKYTCDTVGRFLNECIEKRDGSYCGAQELFQHYEKFCSEFGLDPLTSTMFGRVVHIRGIQKKRTSGGYVYLDIGLRRFDT